MIKLIYTTYISVDIAHHEIFRAKVGKGGIMLCKLSLFGPMEFSIKFNTVKSGWSTVYI